MCPSLGGHPGREGLHPRPGPGAPGGPGRAARAGLADPAVHDALDLCLACKGCASDCPTGVDMASYKSRRCTRPTPADGQAPAALPLRRSAGSRRWARLAAPMAGVVNRVLRGPARSFAKSAAGVDRRRSVPVFAPRTLRRAGDRVACRTPQRSSQAHDRATRRLDLGRHRSPITSCPGTAHAAIGFLEAAGLTVARDRRGGLLRPDLDHHRSAGPARERSSSARSPRWRRTSRAACRSSVSSRPAWRRCAVTPSSSPTTRGPPRSPAAC